MRFALTVLAAMLVGACAPPAAPPPATPTPPTGPVQFRKVASGQTGRYAQPQPAIAVLADAAALEQWWSGNVRAGSQSPAVQPISFGTEFAIAILHGQRMTGGYGIEIKEVRSIGAKVTVVAEMLAPPRDSLVPQVVSSPYEVIAIAAGALPGWRQAHYILQATDGTVLAETDA